MINKRLLSLAAAGLLVMGLSSLAMAGVPDGSQSFAAGPGSGCIRINPTATGPSLASQSLTVTVTVNDAVGDPIAGYPFADINLIDASGGVELVLCNGGSVADGNTNASGVATISGTLGGGGYTQGGLTVSLGGSLITNGTPIPIDVVSADSTRDLNVGLPDVGPFAVNFASGSYEFTVDLDCDGVEDLGDVGFLAADNGQSCP